MKNKVLIYSGRTRGIMNGIGWRLFKMCVGTSIKGGTLRLAKLLFDKHRLRVALVLINFSASTMTQKKSPVWFWPN